MSKFNEFTAAFDDAVKGSNIEKAAATIVDYVRKHSEATGKPLQESFNITRAWMNYDMGENREASMRNTPEGQQAISKAVAALGCKPQGT